MKRMKIAGIGIALIAVLSLVMFTGCGGGGGGGTKSDAAALTTITVAGTAPESGIPTAITKAQWENPEIYLSSLEGAMGRISLPNPAALESAAIAASGSPGAKVAWGTGDDTERAAITFGTPATMNFAAYDPLFIRVTSESGNVVNYYYFQIVTVAGNAGLQQVSIAGQSAVGTGAGGVTWKEAPLGSVGISSSERTDAVVTVVPAAGATAKIAKVAKADIETATDLTFEDVGPLSFEDGDLLVIEVTAQDGVSKRYYKVELQIGRNARLATVGLETPQGSENYLGKPGTSWNDPALEVGSFFTDQFSELVGLRLSAAAEDGDAKIEYVIDWRDNPAANEPFTWNELPASGQAVNPYVFVYTNTYYVYVRVTAFAGNQLYYKMKLFFPQRGTITYGTPDLGAAGTFEVDPLFDAADLFEFDISRVNLAETIQPYFKTEYGQHTRAKAKALWDDDGIYVYVDVTFNQYKETEDGVLKDRPITTGTNHECDSVEIFVNERLQATTATNRNMGNQFRIGTQNQLSGDGTLGSAVAEFSAGQYPTRVRVKGDGTNTGYEVLAFVPFAGKTNAQANAVFNADGTVKDDALIGFELQLNTGVVAAQRDGILTWNGVTTQSYQNATGYGTVVLELAGRTRVKNAQRPNITAQPQTAVVNVNDPVTLSVTASVADGGTLSYQWYKASGVGETGTAVGTDSPTYTVDTSIAGGSYYYVVVTNTNNDPAINGQNVVSVTSAYVMVQVGSSTPSDWEEKITMYRNAVPVYGFVLPDGKTFGDYDKITLKLKVDAASDVQSGRVRAWGTYAQSEWAGGDRLGMQNASPAGLLLNTNANATYTEDWTEVEIAFDNRDTLNTAADIKATSGIVIIGTGLFSNNDSPPATRIYYLKDIVLSKSDGTDPIPALHPEDPRLWAGQGAGKYVHGGESDSTVTRELLLGF